MHIEIGARTDRKREREFARAVDGERGVAQFHL